MERLYYASVFILKMAYLNALMIVFSLIGCVTFGIFPSLTALFFIVRKWQFGENNINTAKTFWNVFRKEFLRSNAVGWLFTLVGMILYINLSLANLLETSLVHFSYYPILMVFILFLAISILIIPVYLHFQTSLWGMAKLAFLFLFISPKNTLLIATASFLFLLVMRMIPGFIPVVGVSGFAYIIMYFSLRIFNQVTELTGDSLQKSM
ncbi:DUF624 domain-containing protein [Gracilibacillus caseinilyticus]|uniref:DUF624 domain-containing protein n=1 Tax=Gracilibacillus caseinilyticus TaxID=2932256 RepID=A0ABY4ERZ4_9BACI|nr:DUF624 domain-containing protein [Gracilibacillus caseinilyticus]UOQ46653.1 DUF624 domain-containing protein [Gracilibacillus caseinilyticus]